MINPIFNQLFILQMANNHWGDLQRGKKIIRQFAKVAKKHDLKCAIKLQFRNVDKFIHKDHINDHTRYINKTLKTKMEKHNFEILVKYISDLNCIPLATPFDQDSVELCKYFNFQIIKVASSDINDWVLLRKIAQLRKPVIVSTGGASQYQIDNMVKFFQHRNIDLCINHCVSKYPTEDCELQLNQIDYLKQRYKNCCIGFSTHEYTDWHDSMLISYAKGVRTWQRHIDIKSSDHQVSKYCSTPKDIQVWFKAFNKAKIMCGSNQSQRRVIDQKQKSYLLQLHRGLYYAHDIKAGQLININELYSAVPLLGQQQQFSSRNMLGQFYRINRDVKKDEPFLWQHTTQDDQ